MESLRICERGGGVSDISIMNKSYKDQIDDTFINLSGDIL